MRALLMILVLAPFMSVVSVYGQKEGQDSEEVLKKMAEIQKAIGEKQKEALECHGQMKRMCPAGSDGECFKKKMPLLPSYCRELFGTMMKTSKSLSGELKSCTQTALKVCKMPDDIEKPAAMANYQKCLTQAMEKNAVCQQKMKEFSSDAGEEIKVKLTR